MYYVELNGHHLFEGTKKECLLQARSFRDFLNKYHYIKIKGQVICLEDVYFLGVCMYAIEVL